MLKIIIFLVAVVSAIASLEDDWALFKVKYQRKYDRLEDLRRRDNYAATMKKVREHNELYTQGLSSFYLGENQFSDWTNEEFFRKTSCLNMKAEFNKTQHEDIDVSELPKSVDWRKEGYVTPIQDQGRCGSCYAFSAVVALEGQQFKAKKELVKLSESQIVDCSSKWGNNGCDGGLMTYSYQYIKDNEGIESAKTYPYVDKGRKCAFQKKNVVASVTGYEMIQSGSEPALQEATANVGPIAVAIMVGDLFRSYQGGVYDDSTCYDRKLEHAVAVVGYGTDDAKDYWLVKNSWGTKWGAGGYIKMARNERNQCGIANFALYPTV